MMYPILEAIGESAVRIIHLEAKVERLTVALAEAQAIAGPWQPCIEDVDLQCVDGKTEVNTMYCGTGIYIDGGPVAVLPDGYALCKRDEGEYITVHRSYIENLEAKANALTK
jgi:hypothetical protein